MVQTLKYTIYLVCFFLILHGLVWTKYLISPEEKTTTYERQLTYEEAKAILKKEINYTDVTYHERRHSVVKIQTDGFLFYKRDTLNHKVTYFTERIE